MNIFFLLLASCSELPEQKPIDENIEANSEEETKEEIKEEINDGHFHPKHEYDPLYDTFKPMSYEETLSSFSDEAIKSKIGDSAQIYWQEGSDYIPKFSYDGLFEYTNYENKPKPYGGFKEIYYMPYDFDTPPFMDQRYFYINDDEILNKIIGFANLESYVIYEQPLKELSRHICGYFFFDDLEVTLWGNGQCTFTKRADDEIVYYLSKHSIDIKEFEKFYYCNTDQLTLFEGYFALPDEPCVFCFWNDNKMKIVPPSDFEEFINIIGSLGKPTSNEFYKTYTGTRIFKETFTREAIQFRKINLNQEHNTLAYTTFNNAIYVAKDGYLYHQLPQFLSYKSQEFLFNPIIAKSFNKINYDELSYFLNS